MDLEIAARNVDITPVGQSRVNLDIYEVDEDDLLESLLESKGREWVQDQIGDDA